MVESKGSPFTFADSNGRPTGFAVDLLRAAAKEQNLTLDIRIAPWPEIIANFKQGQYDILGNVAYSSERTDFIDFSVPNLVQHGGVFSRIGGPSIRTAADLAGKRLAVMSESLGHDYARKRNWAATLVPIMSLEAGIEDLRAGRVDALFNMQLVTMHYVRKLGYRDVVLTPIDCTDLNYQMHFGVHAGDADLLWRINEGLLATHANGTYRRLYEQWIGPLQPQRLTYRKVRPFLLPVVGLVLAIVGVFGWQRWVLLRESRQAEELRLSEERLSLVLEGSQDAFWDWDVTCNQVQRSPRWASMLGYAPEEIASTLDILDGLVHPDDAPLLRATRESIWQENDHFAKEFRLRAKSGEWIWILNRGKVVARDPVTRRPTRIAGTHSDITERKLAEEEHARLQSKMLETQKLESLGVLAGGIAHEFNNLLTVILGNTSLARGEMEANSETGDRLDNILTASNRAADLCRQLLAYAGKGNFAIGRIDLNDVVEETARLLDLSLSKHTVLEFALEKNLPAIEADPSQIRQVVMNLVINASEALGDGSGKIRLETRATRLNSRDLAEAKLATDIEPGDYVRLEIADTGCGMSSDVLAKIFDPFYSTKFTGRGLGLAAVLGIVRSHKGTLRVTSEPSQGSTFCIFLPVAPVGAKSISLSSQSPVAAPARARVVLVVDDEAPVRQLVMDVLNIGGYETVGAEDGQTALEIFRVNPHRFDCVLLDLTMPGLDGPKTLTAMRAHQPEVVGVLMSGYSELDLRVSLAACGAAGFIQKPFTPDILYRKLADACRVI